MTEQTTQPEPQGQVPFPEAGGIAYTTIYTKTGLPINLTARGIGPQQAFTALYDAIAWAVEKYHVSTEKPLPPAASAPKAAETVSKIAETNPALAAQMQTANAEVPPSRKGVNVPWQTCDVDIVEVLPQPDDRVTIHFFGMNDQYPRIKVNKWKMDTATALMAHVTSESMAKPAKFTLPVRVYFTDGKETGPGTGKFYKDVEHVRPR